ncbi:MAG: 30S ribosome-binding factor RbfA [Anaerolineaceae bacterium]|nr:30S ribosome-binding factor RbfA [Anaerolineaceae bacterium]
MPSKLRLTRIADRIRQELAQTIIVKVNDPRLSGVTVTDVKVDRELAYADVYVSAVEGVARAQEVIRGLQHAAGFLRSELAGKVDLRVFPRLRFHWDPTPENADHIEKLLTELHEAEEKKEQGVDTHND